jgi:hypothetical protein
MLGQSQNSQFVFFSNSQSMVDTINVSVQVGSGHDDDFMGRFLSKITRYSRPQKFATKPIAAFRQRKLYDK